NRQEAIRNTAQRPRMGMTALPENAVMAPGSRIVLRSDVGPVMTCSPQPLVTGISHRDDPALAACARDRGDTGQQANAVIVSSVQRLCGLGEHRAGNPDPDSGQGEEDRHVMMLASLPRRVVRQSLEGLLELFRRFGPLCMQELHSWQQDSDVE